MSAKLIRELRRQCAAANITVTLSYRRGHWCAAVHRPDGTTRDVHLSSTPTDEKHCIDHTMRLIRKYANEPSVAS